ncbi:transposase [Salmonella enterica subsp. enterica serovar Java]|nr:transposase [Salmonella enterica subsp. enterica serovar Java]
MQQRDVFSDQASIASWALFSLHRRKLYEYRNANGVKISVKMRSPEHYSERLAVRQMQSKPLLTSLYKLMQEKEHTLSKKCRLRDAFRYIRKHWVALCKMASESIAVWHSNRS